LQVRILVGEFSSPWSNFCTDSYFSICSVLFQYVLLQHHVKDPGYSAKSADDKLQLNTHALCVYIYGFALSDMT